MDQQHRIDSFEALYSEYGTRIYRFCRHLCGNPADADDLVQETFLAAFRGMARFEGRSSVATWLYRIALYQRQKTTARTRLQTVPLDDETEIPPLSDDAQARVARLILEDALMQLPQILRETFLLVKVEGLKLREAAAVLEIPQGTVKSRLHEAIHRLQIALTDDEGGASRTSGVPQSVEQQRVAEGGAK